MLRCTFLPVHAFLRGDYKRRACFAGVKFHCVSMHKLLLSDWGTFVLGRVQWNGRVPVKTSRLLPLSGKGKKIQKLVLSSRSTE